MITDIGLHRVKAGNLMDGIDDLMQGEIIDEYTHHEKIADLTWPLNDTLFFSSLGNADEGPTFNWEFSIWSYRLGDEARQITTTSSRIHTPFVSPDGNWALASKGSGYADAGHIDLSMVVLNLKNDSIDSKEIQWQDFEGSDLSEDMTSSMFLYGTPVWLDNTSVLVHLDHLMDNQPNLKGIYKLDIDTSSIERILEL